MIYIVRHGQTEKNKANVLQGRSDVPLNDAGRRQAEEVREQVRLRFPAAEISVADIGPVIGSHTGPGMFALVFWGTTR